VITPATYDVVHSGRVTHDPFHTEELRRRVLSAWRESPARFRADANLEDDLALVGYRDRVVVELAQNAADAALRAGVRGRLVFELDGDVLTASNNGAPLDAAGVESISVARASAKVNQANTVGRFGVGFAAVLGVSDEPVVVSSLGAVRWSRSDAMTTASLVPALRDELEQRADRVPVLRLPFEADRPLAMDADTQVILPLRDDAALVAVRQQLVAVDATLLFALAALEEVVLNIDGYRRVLRADRDVHEPRHGLDIVELHDGPHSSRWAVAQAAGALAPELLADRPAEERTTTGWQVTWALPMDDAGRLAELPGNVAAVVRAPTAVDDPFTLPAVLVASYPLDASRRRVTPGALADAITAYAAAALVAILVDLPADASMLRLVPTGFPDGPVDGAVRAAVLEAMQLTAWLPLASEPEIRQRPRDAVAVADALAGPLSIVVPALLPAGWTRPALVALGVRHPDVAELVDALANVNQDPAWWRGVYAAFDSAVPAGPERDALGALPVPLVDGTVVTGPRGVALPAEGVPAVDLSVIGTRLVHPAAAHPMLMTLGAVEGTPRGLLEQPSVRAAVEESYEAEDPRPVAEAVLSLARAIGLGSDELPWLANLALPDTAGDWRPAGELLVPGGRLAGVVAEDSAFGVVAADWLESWGAPALLAVGVLDGPAVLREADALGPSHDLDEEEAWWSTLPPDASVEELVAVRDLEQVAATAWPDLLEMLAEPPWRAAVVEPALVSMSDGSRIRARSYTAWWLGSRPILAGRVPQDLRLSSSGPELAGLYDLVIDDGLGEEFLRALGVLRGLDDARADEILSRLADAGHDVDRSVLRVINSWLAGCDLTPPQRVRGIRDGETVIADVADSVVADAPDLLPLLGNLVIIPVSVRHASDLADRLDVDLASELADFQVVSSGSREGDAIFHDALRVMDVDGVDREVSWRLVGDDLHVDRRNRAIGLGRGRAWRDGVWSQRHRLTEALTDTSLGKMRRDEDDFDESFAARRQE
jgi:hypothetical protein